jgi:hypothetical protein
LSGKVRFAARVVGKDVEDGEVVPVNLQRRPEQCLGFSFCDDGAGGGQQGGVCGRGRNPTLSERIILERQILLLTRHGQFILSNFDNDSR